MARRGVMTALQAALAGIGGAAGGYVQMEETKRRRMQEDEDRKRRQALEEAGIRAEQRDILRSGGTQIAGLGEEVAGPMPSAIPLSGVGNAFAAAEQAGGPASSRGAMRQTVGGQTFMLPGAAETRATALANALEQAMAEREVTQRFKTEDTVKAERSAFNALKKAGQVKGEFDPEYGRYVADEEDYRAIRKSLATQRPGTSRADMVEERVLMTIGQMVREGKPGLPGMPNTPYSEADLQQAADRIRKAAGMPAGTKIDMTGGSTERQTGAATPGIASPQAFQKAMGGTDTTVTTSIASTPVTPRVTPPAPAPAPSRTEPTRPSLSPLRQRTADALVRQRDQLRLALEEVESSGRFGSSIDKLNMRSQLATIERQLRNFGL